MKTFKITSNFLQLYIRSYYCNIALSIIWLHIWLGANNFSRLLLKFCYRLFICGSNFIVEFYIVKSNWRDLSFKSYLQTIFFLLNSDEVSNFFHLLRNSCSREFVLNLNNLYKRKRILTFFFVCYQNNLC